MSTQMHQHPAPVSDNALITALATDLQEYTVAAVEEALGSVAADALEREQAVPARLRVAEILADDDADARLRRVATRVSLFMLGDDQPDNLVAEAFPTLGIAGLETLNLVVCAREGVIHPVVDLSPYSTDVPGEMWVASDQTALQLRAPLPPEHVLGIGKASLTLGSLVPRTPVSTAADIGTGCGIQTLHLLAHAEKVVATDISERALAFTRFNILLNADTLGVDPHNLSARVELRAGSMLEPLTGERFELVVTNPPFVISPPSTGTYTYRETQAAGDAVIAQLVSELHTVLTESGQAMMLGNWEVTRQQSWQEKFTGWLDETMDAWVIQRDSADAATYAETWLSDSSEELDPATFSAHYEAYLQDFATRDVVEIGFGWIWLRHRALTTAPTQRLRRFEEHTSAILQPISMYWAQAFADWDAVNTVGIADAYIQVPRHVTEERYQRFGAEHPEVIMARSGAGFARGRFLDTATAAVLGAADGELPAGHLIAAVANLLDLDEPATAELERTIGELVVEGYIEVLEEFSEVDAEALH